MLVHGRTLTNSLECCQACAQIFEGHESLWNEVCGRWSVVTTWIYRFRLVRGCKHKVEYFRLLLHLRTRDDKLFEQEVVGSCTRLY